ncbi:hypothetical protein [Undibacterium sp. WLX3042]|uniref:hypothetical protein n=1 Tax=Undibacterium sp. WLX3042 TaxID=3412686 RepID=UPI003C2C1CC0
MQFQLQQPLPYTRRALASVLVLSVHGLLWLAWQQQHGVSSRADASVIHYLQLTDIRPPPVPEVSSVPPPETHQPPAIQRRRISPHGGQNDKAITTVNPVADSNPGITRPANITTEEPRLNLDELKRSALAIDKQRQPGTIEKIQQSHRRDDGFEKKLADGTKKAERKDCLKAYSGAGLLAIIPLAVSTVVDTGCNW